MIHIFNFTDAKELMKAVMNSDAGTKIIVDTINGNRHELALPATQ